MDDYQRSRAEGYVKGNPKERFATERCLRFLDRVIGVSAEFVESDRNYEEGDLLIPNGATIEVKGQGINPRDTNRGPYVKGYVENYVEVFEAPTWRDTPFEDLARCIGTSPEELEELRFMPFSDHSGNRVASGTKARIGRPAHVSISIKSFHRVCAVVYANNDCIITAFGHGGYVCLYDPKPLLEEVAARMRGNRTTPGRGRSNLSTNAVAVPYSPSLWFEKKGGADWIYAGLLDGDQALRKVKKVLGI